MLLRVPQRGESLVGAIYSLADSSSKEWMPLGAFDARRAEQGLELRLREGFRFMGRNRKRAVATNGSVLSMRDATFLFIEYGSSWSRATLQSRLRSLATAEDTRPKADELDRLVQSAFEVAFPSPAPGTEAPAPTLGLLGLRARLDYRVNDLASPLGDTPLRVAWNDCPWTPTPRGYHLDDELRGHVWAAALENAAASPFPEAALEPLCDLFTDWPTEELTIDPGEGLRIHGTAEKFTRVGLRGWLAQVETVVAALR